MALTGDRWLHAMLCDASAHACLRIRLRLCHVPDSDPCGCRSPALSSERNVFLDVRRHWRARWAAVKPSCLSSKWQPGQWGHLESEVQCIPQQMHELRPDHHKVLQNPFFACCEVGVCRARCCALSLTPGSSHEGSGRVERASSSSEAKPQNQTKPT
jgi:hypothetical protein